MAIIIGQSIGRYQILAQLGEGGMATVYKAHDTRLEREVAIKIIRHDAFPPSQLERILKRFEREAKSLAKLSHPNILGVMDYGEFEGAPYLVLMYLSGGTLKSLMGKPMSWREALRLLVPIAQALEYAHENKVVHRDVKPANILLTENGQPMLSDFGIAKLLEMDEGQTLTGTGVGVGTPEYMAPEQWTDKVTEQSDIYSLGVVLYEMVTGRKPYTADTPAAILLKQFTDPLPRPQQFANDLPEDFENVLIKTLAKKPEDRYASMTEVLDVFDALLIGKKPRNYANTVVSKPLSNDDGRTIDQLEPLPQPKKSFNWLPAVLFAGLLVAAVIIIGGLTLLAPGNALAALFASPTPTRTATLVPTYTPFPTFTPVPTYTPMPTYTPVPTYTRIPPTERPAPTATPNVSPTPSGPRFTLIMNAFCRTLPDHSAPDVTAFYKDTVFPILGRSPDNVWFLVKINLAGSRYPSCWIDQYTGTTSGNMSEVGVSTP